MGRNFLLLLLLLPPSIFSPPTSDLQLLPLYPLLWSFIFPLLLALCLSSFISPSSPILCSLQALPTSRQGLHPRLSCPCEGLQRHLQAGSGTAAGSPAPGEEVGSCSASGRGGGAHPRPHPTAAFCRPQLRVWLLWVDAGITTSPVPVSPDNPNYQASSSPQRLDARHDRVKGRIPSPSQSLPRGQPKDANVLCAPGREGPTGAGTPITDGESETQTGGKGQAPQDPGEPNTVH